MLKIIKMAQFPKGGWTYVQPETGMRFGGNERFKAQCHQILSHRKGNNLPRATKEEVEQDLVDHTCARIPGICIDDYKTMSFSARTNIVTVAAKTEGRPKRKCKSCGGRKANA
jgi:hypothetical protein